MKHYESRLKKIEENLFPKKSIVVMLKYTTSGPESWMNVNGIRYVIPPEADVEKFIQEKSNKIKGVLICSIYLSEKGRSDEK